MSGYMTPGPSATGRRPGGFLRFWQLMIISSILVGQGPIGLPGIGGRGRGPVPCRKCPEWAVEQADGSYMCKNRHRFRLGRKKKGKKKRK